MKTIIISASYSNIGKTTLARNIKAVLCPKNVEVIKFGHHKFNPNKQEKLFNDMQEGLIYTQDKRAYGVIDYLIIESNSIYKFMRPDLGIFLKNSEKPAKETAKMAESFADIVIDDKFDINMAKKIINSKLGNDCIVPAILEQYNYMYRVHMV